MTRYNENRTNKKGAWKLPCLLLVLSLMIGMLLCPRTAEAAALSKKAKPKFVISGCKYTGEKTLLKWKKVKGAKKYIVYRATKKNGKYKKFVTTKKTTIKKKSVGEYYYKVQAISGKIKSKQSAPVHVFPGNGNIFNSLRTSVGGMYSVTRYNAAFRNDSKRNMVFTEKDSCIFYQYNPATGKLKQLETGTLLETVTIAPGKAESFGVRAGAPTVEEGTVLVIKVPFKAGGKLFYLYIGRDPVNTWIPAIKK